MQAIHMCVEVFIFNQIKKYQLTRDSVTKCLYLYPQPQMKKSVDNI